MEPDTTVALNENGVIEVTKSEPVVQDSFHPNELDSEIEGVQSELDNFSKVMDNRKKYLQDRLAYLQDVKSQVA